MKVSTIGVDLTVADPRHEESQNSPDLSDPFSHLSQDDEPGFARVAEMKCSLCSRPNPENHKYCGFCGAPLHASLLTSKSPGNSDFSPPSREELQFLSNREVESPGVQRDRRGWLYLVVGVAVLLAGFAAFERYYEPDSEPRAAAIPSEPVTQPPAMPTPENPALSNESQPTEPAPPGVLEENQKAQLLPAPEPAPYGASGPATAGKVVPAARVSRSSPTADDGSQELADALRALSPANPARNPAIATRLLWRSVGKGNVDAEVTLADLFLKGDGVARSCEQARLLLRTAAGRGSSDAVTKLRTLQCK